MMKKVGLLQEAWNRLGTAQSFVLACHNNPDGDTLGSALALAHVLRREGKDVVVVSEDGVPRNYEFVPEYDTIVQSTERRDFDVGVLIDSEGVKRVGSAAEAILSGGLTACIDHHMPDAEFGDIRVVDSSASSTAEVVMALLEANSVHIDQIVATQLMVGLVNDTGAFRFANTSPTTFRAAARLSELGADAALITREVYESKSVPAMKLLGRALSSIETDRNMQVVWAYIKKSDLEELGATEADTDSVVNFVGYTRGPKVVILFREVQPDSIRISLRSREGVDVNRVARAFGGGGHEAAAGCTVNHPLEKTIKMVVDEALKWTG